MLDIPTREEVIITAIRFMCIPGVRPVNVPAMMPMTREMMSSRSIDMTRTRHIKKYVGTSF